MQSKTMKLTKGYKSKEKSCNKELQKQRKASGNGEIYNLKKYVRSCDHHTRYEATMCPAQILASEPTNILKLPIARARHTGKRI
jgi:hypothetical protein